MQVTLAHAEAALEASTKTLVATEKAITVGGAQ